MAGLALAAPAVAAVSGLGSSGLGSGREGAGSPAAWADGLRRQAADAEHDSRLASTAPAPDADTASGRSAAGQAAAGGHDPAGPHSPAASPSPGQGRQPAKKSSSPPPWHLIYDSIIPEDIPPHQHVATYATGGHAVPADRVAGRGPVLWIDTRATDPRAGALDIEPGDATPDMAAPWVAAKLRADPHALAILYTGPSEWAEVKASVSTLPSWMQARVRWWIANPTGYPHLVPGSDATQWYWGPGYDISSATPRFWP
ncbi:MAG TPA: hypothetical protein VGI64_10735 [Streptosporangiaceae bacterium]